MEIINNVFDQQIEKIIDSFPSIYTKDDVVTLISGLRTQVLTEALELTKTNSFISEMDFQEFSCNVTQSLEQNINRGNLDIYDYSSAEFSIGYNNELSIESIEFNTDAITDELSDILLDQFQQSFGKFITSETE